MSDVVGIALKSACEQEMGFDMVEKVVNEVGMFRVWCSRLCFDCRAVEGAPTTWRIGNLSASDPATPLYTVSHKIHERSCLTHQRALSSPTPNVVISTARLPLTLA